MTSHHHTDTDRDERRTPDAPTGVVERNEAASRPNSFAPPGDPATGDVDVTVHASERWQQRIDTDDEAPTPAIRQAFCEGIRVGHPRAGEARARLYPPAGALLLYRGPEYAPTIVTTYNPDGLLADGALNVEHLVVCRGCQQLADPQRGPVAGGVCSWCDAHLDDAVPAAHLSADDLAALPEKLLPPTRTMPKQVSDRDCPYCDWTGPNNKFGRHLRGCPQIDHSTGDILAGGGANTSSGGRVVTDGGRHEPATVHPGDRVVDRNEDDDYPSIGVVLDDVNVPAKNYPIAELDGQTVAECNPEYPADAHVVLVAFASDLDDHLPGWEDYSAAQLRKHTEQTQLQVYAYPTPRVKPVEPGGTGANPGGETHV